MHKLSEHSLSVVSNLASDRLSVLRVFLDAAALGSFSAAGRQHGISPAATSASMQKLEAALNVTLFERTTRQLRLTEEGQLYQYYCQQALALMNEAEASLQARDSAVRGTIKISAPSDIGRKVLLGFLDEFRQRHPEVQFSLMLSDTPANLVQDDIDIAIRYGQLPDSDRVARQLLPNRRVVCAAPALLARTGIPATPEALAHMPTLVLVTAAGAMQDWRYCVDGKTCLVRVQGQQQTNDGEVLRKWALSGQGFAYKSRVDIADDLHYGRLQTVLDAYFVDSAPLNLLYHRSAFQPARLRLLIPFLLERFATLAEPPSPA
ncbi:MAG: LysR family transcriptional regulator [Burkholderiales bacterium]|nr:LysR family transcriptional regulator [Burkholderiales bacterium]